MSCLRHRTQINVKKWCVINGKQDPFLNQIKRKAMGTHHLLSFCIVSVNTERTL